MASFIESTIESLQSTLSMTKTYEESILPSAKILLTELLKIPQENWPRKNLLSPVDIYVETLSIYLLYLYTKGETHKIPLHCLVNVLIKHPYFINVYQSNKTIDEWNHFKDELLKEFPSQTTQYDHIKTILTADTTSNTQIQRLKFFCNTTYTQVGVPLTTFKDHPYVLINASKGLNQLNSIVIYNNIEKLKWKLLNINTMKSMKPFIFPNQIQSTSSKNTSKNTSTSPSTTSHLINLLLSYDDENSTVTLIGQYPESEIKRILEGSIKQIVPPKEIDLAIKEDFYELTSEARLDVSIIRKKFTILNQIAAQTYQTSTKSTYAENLLKHQRLSEIINDHERVYFEIYLSPISKFLTYSLTDVIEYVTSYIYPDLLTTTL